MTRLIISLIALDFCKEFSLFARVSIAGSLSELTDLVLFILGQKNNCASLIELFFFVVEKRTIIGILDAWCRRLYFPMLPSDKTYTSYYRKIQLFGSIIYTGRQYTDQTIHLTIWRYNLYIDSKQYSSTTLNSNVNLNWCANTRPKKK